MRMYGEKQYSLNESNNISYNFYTSGCKGYCEGCHSHHTHSFEEGTLVDDLWYTTKLEEMCEYKSWKFENIVLLGGEPLDNNVKDVCKFYDNMKETFSDKAIWLYTHFELNEISKEIKTRFDFIKTGMFDINNISDDYRSNGISLVSSNQKINIKGIEY